MGAGPYSSAAEFVTSFLEGTVDANPTITTFAIIDKTQAPAPSPADSSSDPKSACRVEEEGELAGMVSYMNASVANRAVEIGYLVVLPRFQRTHVTTNAVGLLVSYALNRPDAGSPGLGLRRVVWQTSVANVASIVVAERMGFVREGVLKWDRLFAKGRLKHKEGNGRPLPEGSDEDDVWRDTVVLGLCWDTWAEGGRSKVEAAMARRH
jgi:RimJ/RimL family protein N-acetyltransferase